MNLDASLVQKIKKVGRKGKQEEKEETKASGGR